MPSDPQTESQGPQNGDNWLTFTWVAWLQISYLVFDYFVLYCLPDALKDTWYKVVKTSFECIKLKKNSTPLFDLLT